MLILAFKLFELSMIACLFIVILAFKLLALSIIACLFVVILLLNETVSLAKRLLNINAVSEILTFKEVVLPEETPNALIRLDKETVSVPIRSETY